MVCGGEGPELAETTEAGYWKGGIGAGEKRFSSLNRL